MKCDHIKRMISLTSDYITQLSLYQDNQVILDCQKVGGWGSSQNNIKY